MRFKIVIVGLMLIALGLWIPAAAAVPKNKISAGLKVYPVKVDIKVVPGKTARAHFTVVNTADNRVDVTTEVKDFVRNEHGDYKFYKPGQRKGLVSTAAWTKVGPKHFSLTPGESKAVKLAIAVPPGAEPGGHFAMVFATGAPRLKPGLDRKGIIIAKARLGVMIRATVAGRIIDRARLSGFSTPRFNLGGPIEFLLIFSNNGNVHKDIAGTIDVSRGGKRVAKAPVDEWTSLPGSNLRISANLPKQTFGAYRAVVTMASRDGNKWQKSTTFYVVPVKPIILMTGGLMLVLLVIRIFGGRYSLKVEKKSDV